MRTKGSEVSHERAGTMKTAWLIFEGAPTMGRLVLLALLTAPFFLLSQKAEAQTRILISCPSGPPCSERVLGHIDAVGTARLPWVATVAVPANVCFQVHRDSAGSSDGPVIRSVIAPNGTVYRATESTAIQINTGVAGWYTVQLDTPPPNREQIFNYSFEFLQSPPPCFVGAPGR